MHSYNPDTMHSYNPETMHVHTLIYNNSSLLRDMCLSDIIERDTSNLLYHELFRHILN